MVRTQFSDVTGTVRRIEAQLQAWSAFPSASRNGGQALGTREQFDHEHDWEAAGTGIELTFAVIPK
jgi:hypothetical protein